MKRGYLGNSSGLNEKIVFESPFKERSSFSSDKLKRTEDMEFLKEKFYEVKDDSSWSLYENGKKLEPLKFSNGKTQEDVVKEVVNLIKEGNKIIFIRGVCGTGKSAIALNISRILGRAAIVVPVKGLQKQYEEDYMNNKYLIKKDGSRMKIAIITGRDNHDSVIFPGLSCADPSLPDTIKLAEKNYEKIKDYYLQNPYIKNKELPEIKNLKRIAIAPANPYWSPILPASFEFNQLKDAKKYRYMGLRGREFIFYHRKSGCSYYDQYLSYIRADSIIFNSAKYKIEVALDKKPATEVDIIDEADEFLDSFSNQEDLNLTRLASALKGIKSEDSDVHDTIGQIEEIINLEDKNKRVLGIDENKIYKISETKLGRMLLLFLKNPEFEAEIATDELNYSNRALEVAYNIRDFLDETYVMYKRDEKDLWVSLVSTNLSKRFKEIIDKNKALVLMSGTLHSEEVLKKVFGLDDFKIVEAETIFPGIVEIHRTGKEFNCKYSNLNSSNGFREKYLLALNECFKKAKKPVLIHVNAFEDLPDEYEISSYGLWGMMPRNSLKEIQRGDKLGGNILSFKNKKINSLFTTKCSRGVDFPGDICNSIIFTKYPNPNVRDPFWKILEKEHSEYFWDFYRDKARREFLQRIYRALRFKDDHVFVLSPDIRVINSVRDLQR